MLSRQIEHFLCAFERRSLRTAAQVLGLSQPALTKSIHSLEQSLGVALFERRSTGVIPTTHGQTLARYARATSNAWRLAQAELAASSEGLRGELRIGGGAVWSQRVLPDAMHRLRLEYPLLQLTLITDVADYLLPKLADGEIDLVVGSIEGVTADDEIEVDPIHTSKALAYVRQDHPLLANPSVAAGDLAAYDWLAFTHDVNGTDALARFLAARGLPAPNYTMRFTSLGAMLMVTRLGDDIALVSSDCKAEAAERGIVPLDIGEEIFSFATGLAYRRSLGVLAHVRRLMALVREGIAPTTPAAASQPPSADALAASTQAPSLAGRLKRQHGGAPR